MFETTKEQAEIYRWMFLATRLNGAADSGKYGYIDTAVILRHVEIGDVFEFLAKELGADVDYALAKLTDVDRHLLLQHWRTFAVAYEPAQFHVTRSGLSLLVAYVLSVVQRRHTAIPK